MKAESGESRSHCIFSQEAENKQNIELSHETSRFILQQPASSSKAQHSKSSTIFQGVSSFEDQLFNHMIFLETFLFKPQQVMTMGLSSVSTTNSNSISEHNNAHKMASKRANKMRELYRLKTLVVIIYALLPLTAKVTMSIEYVLEILLPGEISRCFWS